MLSSSQHRLFYRACPSSLCAVLALLSPSNDEDLYEASFSLVFQSLLSRQSLSYLQTHDETCRPSRLSVYSRTTRGR